LKKRPEKLQNKNPRLNASVRHQEKEIRINAFLMSRDTKSMRSLFRRKIWVKLQNEDPRLNTLSVAKRHEIDEVFVLWPFLQNKDLIDFATLGN